MLSVALCSGYVLGAIETLLSWSVTPGQCCSVVLEMATPILSVSDLKVVEGVDPMAGCFDGALFYRADQGVFGMTD